MILNNDAVRISQPEDVRPAAEALRTLVGEMLDARIVACHNIASGQAMIDEMGASLSTGVFGWPDEDADHRWPIPRVALAAQIVMACRYSSEPFWCNAGGFHTTMPNRLLAALRTGDGERPGPGTAAIVAPVHLAFGQIGMVALAPRDRRRVDLSAEFREHGDRLGLLARTFIASYAHVMTGPERIPMGPGLSRREVECLQWAAVGKTDYEIGLILARSRATVRFHMHNASMKLDAVNRSQTLFRATQLGYIGMVA
jgi:LuxR family transcriptional regulator, quorum-sensing system regulator CciR